MRGVVQARHPVELDLGGLPGPTGIDDDPRALRAPGHPAEDGLGVADRRRQPDPLHVVAADRVRRSSTAARCPPRSSATKAWISSITTARRPRNRRSAGTFRLINITSRLSGVVSKRSVGIGDEALLARGGDVAVPLEGAPPDQAAVARQAVLEVVEQGADRRDVDH
jgi:hypothetical protein